jgi:hypothetical protein
VDATKSNEQRKLLEAELEAVGIRLNTSPPDGTYTSRIFSMIADIQLIYNFDLSTVVFKPKSAGGITVNIVTNYTTEQDGLPRLAAHRSTIPLN